MEASMIGACPRLPGNGLEAEAGLRRTPTNSNVCATNDSAGNCNSWTPDTRRLQRRPLPRTTLRESEAAATLAQRSVMVALLPSPQLIHHSISHRSNITPNSVQSQTMRE
jgi:hypothetical protein